MLIQDQAVSIHPYWKISPGKIGEFEALCDRFMAAVASEPKCLYYGMSFHGDEAFCREAYADAAGVLAHVENIGPLLAEAMKISQITRIEIHGPEEELNKLKEPLAALNPVYFRLKSSLRAAK